MNPLLRGSEGARSLGGTISRCCLAPNAAARSEPARPAERSTPKTVLAILVLQHLPHPAAFIAEIRRCLRPGGHLLITAPARDGTPLTSQNLSWRLRAACYHRVPGVVRFYDACHDGIRGALDAAV